MILSCICNSAFADVRNTPSAVSMQIAADGRPHKHMQNRFCPIALPCQCDSSPARASNKGHARKGNS